jgi:hypothetical protein
MGSSPSAVECCTMPTLADPPSPVAVPSDEPAGLPLTHSRPARWPTILAGAALILVVVVNVPAFLRTALDCDPILFDLYVRDASRGAVLYRDMLENNTPTMIGLHWAIRTAFGWSTEALRIADLAVVGSAIALLACWFHRGRWDLRLFTAALLATLYLTTTEWCHVQRDVWMLLPVMGSLYLRRAQLGRLTEGRGSFGLAVLEGIVWALAVWIKPHVAVVAAAVWLTGAVWARASGARLRGLAADASGVLVGGLATGLAGVAVMAGLGIWQPYVEHLSGWAGEYSKGDLYGPAGSWIHRLGFLIRNLPWSLLYVVSIPAAIVLAVHPLRLLFTGQRPVDPSIALLAAATAAWAAQAWLLQHVFDYPHIGGVMLAIALILGKISSLAASRIRTVALVALGLLAVIGNLPLFSDRVAVWDKCVRGSSPELKDRLARYPRIKWTDIEKVSLFLGEQNIADGELMVISDFALPVYEQTGITPPVRYYIVQNNVMAFHSRRSEIIASIASNPRQRFLVCDLVALRWDSPPGCDWRHPEEWPLPADWYGPRRWADKVVFRAGRYLVLAMTASDTTDWLADVSDI